MLEFIRPEFGSNDLGLGMSCSRVNKLMNFYRNKNSSSLTAVNIIFHNLMILLRDFLPEAEQGPKKRDLLQTMPKIPEELASVETRRFESENRCWSL